MIEIRSNWAQVGLKTTQAGIRIQTRDPVFKLKQELPRLEMELEEARVLLDCSPFREGLGLKDTADFSKENAQKGYEACLSYIGQVAERGDMMSRPDKYELESILAKYASMFFDKYYLNITRSPYPSVNVTVIPASAEINWDIGDVKGEYSRGEIRVKAIAAQVETYLRQQSGLEIEYTSEVDLYG